jgi:molybdopterin converting factor small subunit
MSITICFYSYFKDLTGCADTTEAVSDGSTINDLLKQIAARYPKLGEMRNSMLIAVGVDYQPRDYVLREGDQVSLFPPVQGG